jgi:hypothetical protein
VELRNRLANESAATAQAARQSTDQFLAILHGSSYAGLESAAQRLSPTTACGGCENNKDTGRTNAFMLELALIASLHLCEF